MKKFLSGILSFVVALVVLELLARVIMTVRMDMVVADTTEKPWYVYSPELGWERKPGFDGTIGGMMRRFDSQGLLAGDSAKLHDRRTKKILFVGDSNTFGNDSPASMAFPSIVDSLLGDAVTINLAAPGYSSYQGKIILRRALQRLHPDIIVASFNFNDRRYVLDSADADGGEMFRRTYEQAQWQSRIEVLEHLYIFRVMRSLVRHMGLLEDNAVRPVNVHELVPRVRPDAYRENLADIARMADSNRIPLIFLVLRDNPQQMEYINRGIAQLERSHPDSAIAHFIGAARIQTLFTALAKLCLKEAYEQIGEKELALQAAIIPAPQRSLQGGYPIRLDRQYNAIMKDVGARFGATVVDAASELEQSPFVYYDFCHFDTTGHKKIAEVLLPHLHNLLSQNTKGGL